MAHLIQHLVEAPRACSYIASETAMLAHRIMVDVDPDELDQLLERGYRRFGPDYFRPECVPCQACVPTRILVDEFVPSRSQRRARNRTAHLRAIVGKPHIDAERLTLYHQWHADRENVRHWNENNLTVKEYYYQFAFPHPSAREIAYYDDEADGRLVALSICDETPQAWSAVYCFYDPSYARLSLGTANVLTLIQIARTQGKKYVYLGFRVSACASLRYKATFHPQEVLLTRPLDFEQPQWQRMKVDEGESNSD